jgi:anoctamin-1
MRTASDYLNKKFFSVDENDFPKISQRFTAIYSRDKEYLFDLEKPNFFNTWVRARICQFILDRQRFSQDHHHDFSFGIERLVNDQTYIAAYALHDGDLLTEGSRRYQLYTKWASLRKIFSYQPLDYVKDYFGVKIGIYFAWLGFYTYMLILASIAGILATVYSVRWMKNNPITEQICLEGNQTKNYIMCPQCDKKCDYWNLTETCLQAEITSLFDNHVTVIFAVFMSFWAALFLEHWKRYSAEITHRWDLTGFDVHEEHPRPQCELI